MGNDMSGTYSTITTGTAGTSNSAGSGGNGGDGLSLTATGTISVTSAGTITGGAGGNGGTTGSDAGGNGGVGIYLTNASLLTNDGLIRGGAGGYNYSGSANGMGGNGVDLKSAGTVVNHGIIAGGAGGPSGQNPTDPGGAGIDLIAGGSLDNTGLVTGGIGGAGTGTIDSGAISGQGGMGVMLGGSATIANSGTIDGGAGGYAPTPGSDGGVGGAALGFAAGGLVTNSGTIMGGTGSNQNSGNDVGVGSGGDALTFSAAGTVVNTGLIAGGDLGISHGTVVPGPTPSGGIGIAFAAGGTLTNAGTIIGGTAANAAYDGAAISFGTGPGALIVDPGAVFIGNVAGNAAYADVLDFASGASAGTLSGIGSQFTGFDTLRFETLAAWTVAGTYTGFDAGQTIAGLAHGDTLILDGFAANTADVTYVSGTGLELTNSAGTIITLDIQGSYATGNFQVTDPASTTTIALGAPCFASGTRILTRRGDIAVEHLMVGDAVVLAEGGTAPIVWLGHRRLDLARHPRPETVRPVLIEAGALADGVPQRDFMVSPDHALYLEGRLIPAKALINGLSIRQIECRSVTYHHVELDRHAALYAEGVAAESYLDTGNRATFENGGAALLLHPDLAQTRRETEGFAPFEAAGPIVETVRARILARAAIATTTDPELTVHYANGAAIIRTRSAIPGHLLPDPRDRRTLGVKIATLTIGGAEIRLDHPSLTQGWHDPEPDGRWTDGNAVIPAELLGGAKSLGISLAATLAYPRRFGIRTGESQAACWL